jgi:hypothetical protein
MLPEKAVSELGDNMRAAWHATINKVLIQAGKPDFVQAA